MNEHKNIEGLPPFDHLCHIKSIKVFPWVVEESPNSQYTTKILKVHFIQVRCILDIKF